MAGNLKSMVCKPEFRFSSLKACLGSSSFPGVDAPSSNTWKQINNKAQNVEIHKPTCNKFQRMSGRNPWRMTYVRWAQRKFHTKPNPVPQNDCLSKRWQSTSLFHPWPGLITQMEVTKHPWKGRLKTPKGSRREEPDTSCLHDFFATAPAFSPSPPSTPCRFQAAGLQGLSSVKNKESSRWPVCRRCYPPWN